MVDAALTLTIGYLAQAGLCLVLGAILRSLIRHHRRTFLDWWSRAWTLDGTYLLVGATATWLHGQLPIGHPLRIVAGAGAMVIGSWQVTSLVVGSIELARDRSVARRTVRTVLAGATVVALAVFAASLLLPPEWRLVSRVGSVSAAHGIAALGAAAVFSRPRVRGGMGRNLTLVAFGLYGIGQLGMTAVMATTFGSQIDPFYTLTLSYIQLSLLAFLGISMVVWLREGERERVESASQALERTEEQLRQAQKMEAVGMLAGGIAHDFNNLLTVIMGYADSAVSRPLDTALRSDLDHIRGAAERAATLTGQLLAFSRKQPQQARVMDLNVVVTSLEKLLRRLIGENIRLLTRLEHEIERVKADAGQIEQIIVNLVVNSRDALPDGGEIELSTGNLVGDGADLTGRAPPLATREGRWVRLTVRDNDCGMDDETRQRAFEPFFTTKDPGRGTGLGLSVVYGIVTQSGGVIDVESAPQSGTAVNIYLPATAEPMDDGVRVKTAGSAQRARETILLVEDEQMVRQLCQKVLATRGYQVLVASNGEEGLRLARIHRGPIDLLISDIVMPGINGRDLANQLRPSRPEMEVLLISGYPDKVASVHGPLDTQSWFLEKPFTPDRLLARVQEILEISGYHRRVLAQNAT